MLMALTLVSSASAPLAEASLFHDVLASIGREPLLACSRRRTRHFAQLFESRHHAASSPRSSPTAASRRRTRWHSCSASISAAAFRRSCRPASSFPRPGGCRSPTSSAGAGGGRPAAVLPTHRARCLGAYVDDPVLQVLGAHVGFNVVLAIVCLPLACADHGARAPRAARPARERRSLDAPALPRPHGARFAGGRAVERRARNGAHGRTARPDVPHGRRGAEERQDRSAQGHPAHRRAAQLRTRATSRPMSPSSPRTRPRRKTAAGRSRSCSTSAISNMPATSSI